MVAQKNKLRSGVPLRSASSREWHGRTLKKSETLLHLLRASKIPTRSVHEADHVSNSKHNVQGFEYLSHQPRRQIRRGLNSQWAISKTEKNAGQTIHKGALRGKGGFGPSALCCQRPQLFASVGSPPTLYFSSPNIPPTLPKRKKRDDVLHLSKAARRPTAPGLCKRTSGG